MKSQKSRYEKPSIKKYGTMNDLTKGAYPQPNSYDGIDNYYDGS